MTRVVETVRTRTSTYSVVIGAGALEAALEAAVEARRLGAGVVTVTSPGVKAALPAVVARLAALGPIHITAHEGETAKSATELTALWEALAAARLGRDGLILALGGGVIGDLAGFAAASYLRGLALIQIPTTLLAMVDSSVGGKTGINLTQGKNLAGAFHAPQLVAADTTSLKSLPARELSAGMAEVIKYGLLGDAEFFARIEKFGQITHDHPQLAAMIQRCVQMKAAIVAGDEHERAPQNGRALLNLGHTFAHAIEAVAGYGTYLHGEAVAVGLVMAATLSENLGLLTSADTQRIIKVLTAQGLPTRLRRPLLATDLLEAMQQDKKMRGGQLRFVILSSIGRAETREGISREAARAALVAHGAQA